MGPGGNLTDNDLDTLLGLVAQRGLATYGPQADPTDGRIAWTHAQALIDHGLARLTTTTTVGITPAGCAHATQLIHSRPGRNPEATTALLEHSIPDTTWEHTDSTDARSTHTDSTDARSTDARSTHAGTTWERDDSTVGGTWTTLIETNYSRYELILRAPPRPMPHRTETVEPAAAGEGTTRSLVPVLVAINESPPRAVTAADHHRSYPTWARLIADTAAIVDHARSGGYDHPGP